MKLETSALSKMQEKAHSIAAQLIEGQDFVSSVTQHKYLKFQKLSNHPDKDVSMDEACSVF